MATISINKKDGTLKSEFVKAINYSRIVGNKIYPVSYEGSGRHIRTVDRSFYIKTILIAKGYKFKEGNDAPRGGASGNYISMSSIATNYIFSLVGK